MKGQAWRTVRTLGLAFLLISGLGALVDEKGMGKSMGMANSDMQPQMETNTKFEDVKGVDEAKVRPPHHCKIQIKALSQMLFDQIIVSNPPRSQLRPGVFLNHKHHSSDDYHISWRGRDSARFIVQ